MVGVVGLRKFPRTSAEFPPSAAATHVPASVISQCQVGSGKTTFHGLHYVGLCILSRNRMSPSPNFIQGTIFPETRAYLGRENHNAPTRPPQPLKVNAGQRGFLPTSASAAARNYLGSRLTWKGSIIRPGRVSFFFFMFLHNRHAAYICSGLT